jgi:hypothetical protein
LPQALDSPIPGGSRAAVGVAFAAAGALGGVDGDGVRALGMRRNVAASVARHEHEQA